jgi:TatD DNase family protein
MSAPLRGPAGERRAGQARRRMQADMDWIDTHAHLTFDELYADVEQVISRSRMAGVRRWITVGTDPEHNRKAVDLAGRYEDVYAAVGIHPHYAKDVTEENLAEVRRLAGAGKVVAIGETGLDYHYTFSEQDAQQRLFRTHLDMAAELELPVIIHCREAFDDVLDILAEFNQRLAGVVFHCFSGGPAEVDLLLERGYHVSFTGIVTFRSGQAVRDAAAKVPLERMMLETDCPYMSPEPVRNQRPCEPALLLHTAARIAELKGLSLEALSRAVTATSERFFRLD